MSRAAAKGDRVTYYVVQAFVKSRHGLETKDPREMQSAESARRLAKQLAPAGGAVAFSRVYDKLTGDCEEPKVILMEGSIPESLLDEMGGREAEESFDQTPSPFLGPKFAEAPPLPPRPAMSREAAESVAAEGLNYLAADEERSAAFLEASGFHPDELRRESPRPAFMQGVLDHILADEKMVIELAERVAIAPGMIGAAAQTLEMARDGR